MQLRMDKSRHFDDKMSSLSGNPVTFAQHTMFQDETTRETGSHQTTGTANTLSLAVYMVRITGG